MNQLIGDFLCEASMVSLSNHDGTKETKGYQFINYLIGKSSFQFINLSPIQTPSYHPSTGSGWIYTPFRHFVRSIHGEPVEP
jgi:hypothetical protein